MLKIQDMTKVLYYTTTNGENPARKFIESLQEKQQRKIVRVLTYIRLYGLVTAIPHTKKLAGAPLWEIRILGSSISTLKGKNKLSLQ